MSRRINDHAIELLEPDAYRSDEWYEQRRLTVSASEVGMVLQLSPHKSPFDLWWQKKTGQTSDDDNRDTRRGRRYERLILEDFTEEHPEFAVVSAGLCVNTERTWQACTPDGLVYELGGHQQVDEERLPVVEGEPVAVVEAKSAANRDEWGEPGSDEVPAHYLAQARWQMDVLGLTVCYMPVVFGFEYREYVIEQDDADVKLMREAAQEFLTSLAEDRQPDIDAHAATARRLKLLHPSVVDAEVEIPATLVRQRRLADRLYRLAKQRRDLADNRIRAALGDNRIGAVGGRKAVSRSVFDVKERTQTIRAHTQNNLYFTKKDVI